MRELAIAAAVGWVVLSVISVIWREPDTATLADRWIAAPVIVFYLFAESVFGFAQGVIAYFRGGRSL